MAKRGRPTFVSQGKSPPKSSKERSRKSYARMKEDKFKQFFARVEALILYRLARDLKEGGYKLMTGGCFEARSDVDHAAARKNYEAVMQETEWALTDD